MKRLLIISEIALVYSLIILYIWSLQFSFPQMAWLVLLWIFFSPIIIHRDPLRALGLGLNNLGEAFKETFTFVLPWLVVLFGIGLASRKLPDVDLSWERMIRSSPYFPWAFLQQYGMQSYFHRRLMKVSSRQGLNIFLVALIFGSFHLPNPILTLAALTGGFLTARVFSRSPNLIPLGLAHGIIGQLMALCMPDGLLHRMRVGPGYFSV